MSEIKPTANDPLAPLTASLRCEGSGSARISKCVVWASGGTERKTYHYTLPVYNPYEVVDELERQGYKEVEVVPWKLAKAWCLWCKILFLISRRPERKSLVMRGMRVEKFLIVQFRKLCV